MNIWTLMQLWREKWNGCLFFVIFFSPIVSLCLCFCLSSLSIPHILSHTISPFFHALLLPFHIFTHVVWFIFGQRASFDIVWTHNMFYIFVFEMKEWVFGADIMFYDQLYVTLFTCSIVKLCCDTCLGNDCNMVINRNQAALTKLSNKIPQPERESEQNGG